MATPKEIFDRQMAEKRFYNSATNFGNQSIGGTGGPRRGGTGRGKLVRTQTITDNDITEVEKETLEDGSETEVKTKVPISIIDNEALDIPILGNDEVTFPDTNIRYGGGSGSSSGRWGGPARAGFMGQTGTRPYGPIPAKDIYGRDRWLTEDEYKGTGNASRWLSRPPTESIESEIFGSGIDIEQSGSETLNDQGTLAITDEDRANAQSSIIESINNQRMMELYNTRSDLYDKVVEGELDMPLIEDPHKDKDYTTPGFDGSTLHSDSVPGSFVSETFDKYRNEDGAIVDSPFRSDAFDEDNPLFTTLHPEAANKIVDEEKLKDEEEELEKNFEDIPWAPDKGIDLEDVVKEIKETNPDGIEVLNEFATWADTVPDEVAIQEAKDYLQSLKDSPTVEERFRKAMAIGLVAMLFGDDFTTAMNTGFGVVADDYTAEAEEAKAEAEAAADLAKTVAAEQRANAEWDRRTLIDAEIAYAKELRATNAKENEERLKELEKISSDNFNYIKDRSSAYWASLPDEAKDKFENINDFQIQMDRALDWMNRNWTGQVDFGNSSDQRVGFEHAFSKWMRDKQMFDAPAFENYIQDAFIKIKFAAGKDGSDATYIEPSLISPSVQSLQESGDYNLEMVQRGKESVAKLYEKVEAQVIPDVGTEKHALMLLKKDFNDFRDYEFDGTPVPEGQVSARYDKLLKASNDVGEGVFTRFVLQLPPKSMWGTVYDPAAKGKSATERGAMSAAYLKRN